MALTDIQIKNSKAKEKVYKLYDTLNLHLLINPNGSKLWRFKFRFAGKEKTLALGKYPDVPLKEAREKRDAARKQLEAGNDPSLERKREKRKAIYEAENTFKSVAEEWIKVQETQNLSPKTIIKNSSLLKQLYHDLGNLPISKIEPLDIHSSLKKLEKTGKLDSTKRICNLASRVFDHAILLGMCKYNPVGNITKTLATPIVKHRPALLDKKEIGGLLRAIDDYQGSFSTKQAMKLLPHVFVRPGELRFAEWSEFDLNKKIWTIPAQRMKMKSTHIVPLTRQSLKILQVLKLLKTNSNYLFPSVRSAKRPMSENTLNTSLRIMGYAQEEMCAHGFRSIASTLLNESGKFRPDVIERQLAHAERNKVRAAYHRAEYLDERIEMMQWWSNYLDDLKNIK